MNWVTNKKLILTILYFFNKVRNLLVIPSVKEIKTRKGPKSGEKGNEKSSGDRKVKK